MRRIAVLIAIALVFTACGDDDTVATSAVTPSSAPATSAAASSTTTATPTTEAAPVFDGPTDCLEIWPEAAVQAVAGPGFTFFGANADGSACTYTALPDGIAMAWRTSDRAGFDQSKAGAAGTGAVVEVPVCDAGFYTEIQGAVLIMEGYSATQGRAYNATISGLDLSNAEEWAATLIGSACG